MDTSYNLDEIEEKQLNYLNNRFGKIRDQYDYKFSLSQHLKFSKYSNKKVFRVINIILLALTIFVGFILGHRVDFIVGISMILFIRFFGLLLKISIFIINKKDFKAEIRENGIVIYYGKYVNKAYDIKEISNIEMEKFYVGSMSSIKFAISDMDGIKHYYYRPYDDVIEKFCNDSILYYKKRKINLKIPIDNREPITYEAVNLVSDCWLLLSEDEKWEVEKYLLKGMCIFAGVSLFLAITIFVAGDDSKSGSRFIFPVFLFFFIIFALIHMIRFLDGFKTSYAEIKENMITISKLNLSYDYIKCSSIEDAKYVFFKNGGIEGIKLAIISDGEGYVYVWPKSEEMESFCNEVVDIAKRNEKYYSKTNSSD